MIKKKTGRLVIGLVVILILSALGYYIFSEKGSQEKAKVVEAEKTETTVPEQEPVEEIAQPPVEEIVRKPITEETIDEPEPETDPCTEIKEEIADFFDYLDTKAYIKHIDPDPDTFGRFRDIIESLGSNIPVPAGEGIDHKVLIKNIYHFYHSLNLEDFHLIKEILVNEADSIELNLDMFYRWVTEGRNCPETEKMLPSEKTLYSYAGFFLNTNGGRACLFRRSSGLRILITFYSLSIINRADRDGYNTFGIDIFPFIDPLRKEILRYPDLQYQKDYVSALNDIEEFYRGRR